MRNIRLKKIYWATLKEIPIWVQYILSLIPGRLGMSLREKYYSKKLGSCGIGLRMAWNVTIASPECLHLGSHVGMNIGAYITAGGGVNIGDYVGIGPDVKIWSVNHIYTDPHVPWRNQGSESKAVHIEDDVWVAAGSIVLPGVRIGKGAIISAGSVVSKSIPSNAIVAGNPGRVVGWRLHPQDAKKKWVLATWKL